MSCYQIHNFSNSFQGKENLEKFLKTCTDGFLEIDDIFVNKDIHFYNFEIGHTPLEKDEYFFKFEMDDGTYVMYKLILKNEPWLKVYCECGCRKNFISALFTGKFGKFFPLSYGCISSDLISPETILMLRHKHPQFKTLDIIS